MQVVVHATSTDASEAQGTGAKPPAKLASIKEQAPKAAVQEPKWLKTCRKYLDAPKTPQQIVLQDKLTFMLGLANIM